MSDFAQVALFVLIGGLVFVFGVLVGAVGGEMLYQRTKRALLWVAAGALVGVLTALVCGCAVTEIPDRIDENVEDVKEFCCAVVQGSPICEVTP